MKPTQTLSLALIALSLVACNADNGGSGQGGSGTPTSEAPLDTGDAAGAENATDISGYSCTTRSTGVVTPFDSGSLCELGPVLDVVTDTCGVEDADFAGDAQEDTFANVILTSAAIDPAAALIGLEAEVGVLVDLPGAVAAGQLAAFDVEVPGGLAQVDILNQLNVTTFLNGVAQETTDAAAAASLDGVGLINIDLLSAIPNSGRFLAGFEASLDYNQIQLNVGANVASVDLGDTVHVHDVCTAGVAADI